MNAKETQPFDDHTADFLLKNALLAISLTASRIAVSISLDSDAMI
jgi:hypothetical protein